MAKRASNKNVNKTPASTNTEEISKVEDQAAVAPETNTEEGSPIIEEQESLVDDVNTEEPSNIDAKPSIELETDTQDESSKNEEESASEDTQEPNKRPAKKVRFFTDENGNKWGFTRKTPKSFRFNGVVKKQAQWLKDEDAMEMLVYGNSTYVKQIKK